MSLALGSVKDEQGQKAKGGYMRYIGIRHRVKKTKQGEAKPTMVALGDGTGDPRELKLETETDELDFVRGRLPMKWRAIKPEENPASFLKHHVRWCAPKDDEDISGVPEAHRRVMGKKTMIATKVPAAYEGLRADDRVAAPMGGSGGYLVYACARQGRQVGADVLLITPVRMRQERGGDSEAEKANDHKLLVRLAHTKPELFRQAQERDLELLRLAHKLKERLGAQKDRIRCSNRLFARTIGRVFFSEPDLWPEGPVADAYAATKANDIAFAALAKEEDGRETELSRLVCATDAWQKVFSCLEGIGPILAAPLVVAIGDIGQYRSDAALKAALGVHVKHGGAHGDLPPELQFPRKRTGEVANWQGMARQALYLFADQCNRRPNSVWGAKLLKWKTNQRVLHPVVECSICMTPWEQCTKQGQTEKIGGKERTHARKYTDGHILTRAKWRTLSRFVEWLFGELNRVERTRKAEEAATTVATEAA